jgi:hypothetical protein
MRTARKVKALRSPAFPCDVSGIVRAARGSFQAFVRNDEPVKGKIQTVS